jgi:small conductance mechanosensitive channel
MPDVAALSPHLPVILGGLAAAALAWVLLRLATRGIDRVAARLEREGPLEEGAAFAKRLTRFVRSTLSLLAVLAAGVVMLRGIGVRGVPRVSAEQALQWLMGPGLRLVIIATSAYLIARTAHFLIESLQIFLASRDAGQTDRLERRKRVDTIGQLLRVVATLLVGGVAILMALSIFSVDIRPILTGAGIAGLAVGFGAQNLVRDVIAGFFLILENQVRLGDVVSINGKSGLVEAIRLRTIMLRGLDGTVHIIPNGVITELSNMTKDFSYAVLDVGVAYKENVDAVVDVLKGVAAELQADPVHGPSILEPLEVLGVDALAESSVVLKIRMKTVPIQQWNVGRELRRRIKIAFDARGIEIPFPHVSVHVGEGSRPFAVQVAGEPRGN